MLNRNIPFSLLGLLLSISSVMADPPITPESYQSVIRNQASGAASDISPSAIPSPGRLVQPISPPVKTIRLAAVPAKDEPIRSMKTAPLISPRSVQSQPQPPCENCASRHQYEGCPHCRGGYMYAADPFGFCVRNALNAQ